MKTFDELKQENQLLKLQVEDLKFISNAWQTVAKDQQTAMNQLRSLAGIPTKPVRTLRIIP